MYILNYVEIEEFKLVLNMFNWYIIVSKSILTEFAFILLNIC